MYPQWANDANRATKCESFFHLEKPVRSTVGKLITALSCREGREWKFLIASLKLLIFETLHNLPFIQVMYFTGLVFYGTSTCKTSYYKQKENKRSSIKLKIYYSLTNAIDGFYH